MTIRSHATEISSPLGETGLEFWYGIDGVAPERVALADALYTGARPSSFLQPSHNIPLGLSTSVP